MRKEVKVNRKVKNTNDIVGLKSPAVVGAGSLLPLGEDNDVGALKGSWTIWY